LYKISAADKYKSSLFLPVIGMFEINEILLGM